MDAFPVGCVFSMGSWVWDIGLLAACRRRKVLGAS